MSVTQNNVQNCPRCQRDALWESAIPRQKRNEVVFGKICNSCGLIVDGQYPPIDIMPFGMMAQFEDYAEILEMVLNRSVQCVCQKYVFNENDLQMYSPHEGGLNVPYKDDKCWIYAKCRKAGCGYELSFQKFKNHIAPFKGERAAVKK